METHHRYCIPSSEVRHHYRGNSSSGQSERRNRAVDVHRSKQPILAESADVDAHCKPHGNHIQFRNVPLCSLAANSVGILTADHDGSPGADNNGPPRFQRGATMNKAHIDFMGVMDERPKSAQGKVEHEVKVSVRNLDFFYGNLQALYSNNLDIVSKSVTAIIGPSGCGKSTHIRVYNRIYEPYRDHRATGEIMLDETNILSPSLDILELRRRIGMIFQKPTPFPMTVFENVAWGLKLHYKMVHREIEERVERALRQAALFEEVKDKLHQPGQALSGGQQQRLCIARAIAIEPEIILMDEPTSAIDPTATGKIEELIESLKENFTIVIVTHNMQQAARVSDYTAFFYEGRIIETGPTGQLFTNPRDRQTEAYITGRFG